MAAVTRARIPVWALSFVPGAVGLVGYDACFTRRRSRVRTSDCVRIRSGRVAQMAERRSNKPSVVGSIPTVTTFCQGFGLGGLGLCGKMEVLPGFEPGSLDSKSRVLTITPWERIACLKELVKSSSYGDRTHDPWLIRPMLYHLS